MTEVTFGGYSNTPFTTIPIPADTAIASTLEVLKNISGGVRAEVLEGSTEGSLLLLIQGKKIQVPYNQSLPAGTQVLLEKSINELNGLTLHLLKSFDPSISLNAPLSTPNNTYLSPSSSQPQPQTVLEKLFEQLFPKPTLAAFRLPLEEFFRQSPIQNLETRGVSFQKSIEPQIQSALKDNEGTQILFSKDFQSSEAIYRKLFEVITGRQQHQPPLQEYAQKTESPTIPTPLSQEHSPTPTATLHTVLHQLQEALQKPNLELKDLSELVSVVENLYKELQSNPRMFDTRTREPISQQFLEEAFSGIRDKLKSLLEDDSRASSTTRTALIKQINLLLRHIHQSDQPESSSERTTIETYETLKHQFEKIDFKDTSRTSSQKTAELLENYFQGQEALRRLHPLMQQLKEPMLFIIPGFLQSFMKNLEVRFLPPETFENQSSGEKETYERFSLTFAFPSLGNIRADVAYRGTHLLLSIAAESEAAVECIDKNLDRLRLALSHLGFQSQQLITRKLQDHQHSIQPEWFRDLLGTRRIA